MPATRTATIKDAETHAEVEQVATLFRAYQASLDVDLCFQGFEAELRELPGKYAASLGGALLLAQSSEGHALGCVALRATEQVGVAEMKRLYVTTDAQGGGIGKALVDAIFEKARLLGYKSIRLDTLPSMTKAIALYRDLGFRDIPPYYQSPFADMVFLECVVPTRRPSEGWPKKSA